MKYAVSKSFGIFAKFRPPFCRALFPVASLALRVMRPRLRGVSVIKYKTDFGGVKFPVYVISPKGTEGKTLPSLVYFHGGGFVYRAAPYHWRNAALYAQKAGCRVIMPDYPLVYNNKFSVVLNTCRAAYKWVCENSESLKIERGKIALGGDSAGGCIAADVALCAEEGERPCFLFLCYPVLDRRQNTDTMREFTDTPMWNSVSNNKMWSLCLSGGDYVSPAERADLSCLPCAYVETAEFDCLKDEGEEFAARLGQAGKRVELNKTAGTMHGFDIVRKSAGTKAALNKRIAALRSAFL